MLKQACHICDHPVYKWRNKLLEVKCDLGEVAQLKTGFKFWKVPFYLPISWSPNGIPEFLNLSCVTIWEEYCCICVCVGKMTVVVFVTRRGFCEWSKILLGTFVWSQIVNRSIRELRHYCIFFSAEAWTQGFGHTGLALYPWATSSALPSVF